MKLSVVIPVYNIEKYLNRCIDSILCQNKIDFELLLVIDGSSDSSADICEYYRSIDKRIRVFHQKNGGVSKARNFGLNNSRGEWVLFVDGDDEIEKDCFEKIYFDIEVDLIVLKSRKIFINSTKFVDVYPVHNDLYMDLVSGNKAFVDYNYTRGSVCGVLFKKNFLDKHTLMFSEELKHAEDTLFMAMCQYLSTSIKFLNIDFYNVYERKDSASSNIKLDDILRQLKSLDIIEKNIEAFGVNIKNVPIFNFFVYSMISNSLNSFFEIKKTFDDYIGLKSIIKKSNLYPICINKIAFRKYKIKLLNYSIDMFSIFLLIKKFKRLKNLLYV
jgi:glycosyltransferase involved in cell wall biosynthesis